MFEAELLCSLEFRRGSRRADHGHPRSSAELERGSAHATSYRVHEQRLSWLEAFLHESGVERRHEDLRQRAHANHLELGGR